MTLLTSVESKSNTLTKNHTPKTTEDKIFEELILFDSKNLD